MILKYNNIINLKKYKFKAYIINIIYIYIMYALNLSVNWYLKCYYSMSLTLHIYENNLFLLIRIIII